MPPTVPIPVAQYLRMSTEGQEYSMENQKAAIQEYAQRHGFAVVQTYADAGRSGLVLKRRTGLARLLREVVKGDVVYKAILVYDISRWGRFQDVDEAAHYEFLCRQAGIPVHYCAEPFANDGSLPASILKALKRTMAAEFSREFGVKVRESKRRLTLIGFWMGGCPGYGLRRMLISPDGRRKQRLAKGELKSLKTDRVILVPGPKREIEQVRDMFARVLHGRERPGQIAHCLNQKGILTRQGKPWEAYSVRRLLTNPAYTGCNVWGRTSTRLRGPTVSVSRQDWLTKEGAFAPIINRRTFDLVQIALQEITQKKSNEELLQQLRRLLATKGKLTQSIIERARTVAGYYTYRHRFGSIRRTYELVGHHAPPGVWDRYDLSRRTQRLRDDLIGRIQALSPGRITISRLPGKLRPVLQMDNDLRVSVIVCRTAKTRAGTRKWFLNPVAAERRHVTLLGLLNDENVQFHSFYLFPGIDKVTEYRFGADDPWLARGLRLDGLSEFPQAARALGAGLLSVDLVGLS